MGSDLFGSLAESICACLVISCSCPEINNTQAFLYPLMISGVGIFVCFFTSFFSTNLYSITKEEDVEASLKAQLIISTILLTPALYFLPLYTLPATMKFAGVATVVTNHACFVCTALGLWSGLIIGYVAEYYTSNSCKPV